MCGSGESCACASSPHGARLSHALAFPQPDRHVVGGAVSGLQTENSRSDRGGERRACFKCESGVNNAAMKAVL
jgi:hypothetical protein